MQYWEVRGHQETVSRPRTLQSESDDQQHLIIMIVKYRGPGVSALVTIIQHSDCGDKHS